MCVFFWKIMCRKISQQYINKLIEKKGLPIQDKFYLSTSKFHFSLFIYNIFIFFCRCCMLVTLLSRKWME